MSEEIRPFEEYKEMIKDMRKEEMIRGLYDLSSRVTKQENIIKEVREYIEKDMKKYGGDIYITCKDILEILNKENK